MFLQEHFSTLQPSGAPSLLGVSSNQSPRSGERVAGRSARPTRSNSEALCGTGPGLGGFFFAVLRRRGGFEGMQEAHGDVGYFADGDQKRLFVSL